MHGFFAIDAIANWIWQGSVVALAATIVLRTRRISATTRYRAWWIALAIVVLLPFLGSIAVLVPFAGPPNIAAPPSAPIDGFNVVIPELSWAGPTVIALAGLWCAVHLWRTAAALTALRRAKRSCLPFPEGRALALRGWTALRGSGRRVRLVVSEDVSAAAVLGLTSPAIAVSPAILRGLNDDELDRVVVHEWAHVQRRDDWGRLVQLMVRSVAGFHPAVWWIDRQVHLEREIACDDWAVSLTGSPRTYAACLAKVAAVSTRSSEPALLPGVLNTSDMMLRIVRLLDGRRSTTTRPRVAAAMLLSPLFVITALAVAGVKLIVIAGPALTMMQTEAVVVAANLEAQAPAPEASDIPKRRSAREREPDPPAPALSLRSAAGTGMTETTNRAATESPLAIPVIPAIAIQAPAAANDLPGTVTSIAPAPSPVAAATESSATSITPTPWGTAADAGVSIGRGSQKAAVATAGFLTKLGKSIARSF